MRVISEKHLRGLLGNARWQRPRMVVSGNAAVPFTLLALVDATVPEYRLFMLNAPAGLPLRDDVTPETPFVGPGMRGHPKLSYFPCRLSLVPRLFHTNLRPDLVLLNVTPPRRGTVSLGVEVNVLPAAIEAAHANGGMVVAQINGAMPRTFGDALVSSDEIDYALVVDETLHSPAGSAARTGDSRG